jgi:hypothetical protein
MMSMGYSYYSVNLFYGSTSINILSFQRRLCLPWFGHGLAGGKTILNFPSGAATLTKIGDKVARLKALVDAEAQILAQRVKPAKTREEQMAIVTAETDPIRFFDDHTSRSRAVVSNQK